VVVQANSGHVGAHLGDDPTLGARVAYRAFDDRGSRELKGVPDLWPVLAVREA
jgi:hypothetical protein